jgi:uncharacterized protein (DUF1786 family)
MKRRLAGGAIMLAFVLKGSLTEGSRVSATGRHSLTVNADCDRNVIRDSQNSEEDRGLRTHIE